MKTVLIMEDQLELASYWREILEDAGYGILHARNTDDAASFLAVDKIDVVITDILIRDDDKELKPSGGLSLLAHINLHVETDRPKIIAVSGSHPDLHVLQHAQSMGADVCLLKPFNSEQLIAAVAELAGA